LGDKNETEFHPLGNVGSLCSTPTPPPQTKVKVLVKKSKTTARKMVIPTPKPLARMGKQVSLDM
jgi:hypothetical protein